MCPLLLRHMSGISDDVCHSRGIQISFTTAGAMIMDYGAAVMAGVCRGRGKADAFMDVACMLLRYCGYEGRWSVSLAHWSRLCDMMCIWKEKKR
jgi:hypothetical protein